MFDDPFDFYYGPIANIMRTKYREFPEYHTSKDDLSLVSAEGLGGAFRVHRFMIDCLERNDALTATVPCVPRLGDRGLYPTKSGFAPKPRWVTDMMSLLAYADGEHDVLDTAEILGVPMWDLIDIVESLAGESLVTAAPSVKGSEKGIACYL